ncbi:mannitol dehydrogenase [Ruminococcaceae bacterium OttesenSCG-928-A11]|nr:mannitol dehydrogenase [Ruminococcaceae bacterium OttesenSCG-928-A11]
MKAVMYGGGNIGRGFIGALLSASGYAVTFVDVAKPVVDGLNTRGSYPVRIVSSAGHEDTLVTGVNAVDGGDTPAVAAAIAGADIMATAVGVNVLKFIIPNLLAGIRQRMAQNGGPLNIIICENLMDANKVLEGMLKAELSAGECAWFDENIGLVEASIGRMVPVQTPEMQDGDPLRVCVERYGFLPADRDAFKGPIPAIKNLVPASPFDFYLKRKLYVHNMGHATCAYLGLYTGKDTIWQSVDDADTLVIVQNAMQESARALAKKYTMPLDGLMLHIEDLLHRFTNRALGDTCLRVGGDTVRKLAPADRMLGSLATCLEQGVTPAYIPVGVAGALYWHLQEKALPQTVENAAAALEQIGQLAPGKTFDALLALYELYRSGAPLADLRRAGETLRAEQADDIV